MADVPRRRQTNRQCEPASADGRGAGGDDHDETSDHDSQANDDRSTANDHDHRASDVDDDHDRAAYDDDDNGDNGDAHVLDIVR